MKPQTRKTRLLVAVIMLLSVTALNLPGQSVNATMEFCSTCGAQAYEATWGMSPSSYYNACRAGGGSVATCTDESRDHYNDKIMVCNWAGCDLPYAQ